MATEPIADDLLTRWAIQLTRGAPLVPAPHTPRQLAVASALERDIKKIMESGGIIELPFDIPGWHDYGLVWALRAWMLVGALVWCFALLGVTPLFGQVDAGLHLRGQDGEMRVANPTTKTLHVGMVLFTDSTLVDTVPVRISPSDFTLAPGAEQMVRLRLRQPMAVGATYRLATMFLPVDEAEQRPMMVLRLAVRILTRVVVEAGP